MTTTTATMDALSPTRQIMDVIGTLAECDHAECAPTLRNPERAAHCPLCGGTHLYLLEGADGTVAVRCTSKARCDQWGVARAILPHLEALGIDPSPLWDGIPQPGGVLPFQTARAFALDAPPAPAAMVAALGIAGGVKTELSASPKAGKTTLVLAAIAAMLSRREFLGRPTMRAPVYYLAEENSLTLRLALERAGLLGADDMHVLQRARVAGRSLDDVIEGVCTHAQRYAEPALIFLDTLPSWAGFEGEEENFSGSALRAVQPLDDAAAAGFGVAYNRHNRKGGGAVGEAGRGSTAFAGAADNLLSLWRPGGNAPGNRRILSGIGRLDGLPDRLVIEYRGGTYEVVGEGASGVLDDTTRRVLELLPPANADPVTLSEIAAGVTGASRPTVSRALAALVDAGSVEQITGLGANGRAKGFRSINHIGTGG